MEFSEEDRLKALAIVHIFETSRPFGNYAACVVLNDGAGVSYGISQFTHRSGSLLAVVEAYLNADGKVGAAELNNAIPMLRRRDAAAIGTLATDFVFRKAIRQAAETLPMRAAQNKIATEKYLKPAIDFCLSHGFTLPISLAICLDSITHGSFERIASMVSASFPRASVIREKIWIREYVEKRDRWLSSIPRLRPTVYRTLFFLHEIEIRNWELRLPLMVHGVPITLENLKISEKTLKTEPIKQLPAVGPTAKLPDYPANATRVVAPLDPPVKPAETEQAQPPVSDADRGSVLETATEKLGATRDAIDSVGNLAGAISARADSAKSLWTVVSGSITQFIWAVLGFFIGLPREVWIVVAVIAAALTLLYLYRQIVLGRIRESKIEPAAHDLKSTAHD